MHVDVSIAHLDVVIEQKAYQTDKHFDNLVVKPVRIRTAGGSGTSHVLDRLRGQEELVFAVYGGYLRPWQRIMYPFDKVRVHERVLFIW